MKDYRKPEHRAEYFNALYRLNLEYRIMPGLVYLYMPALKAHYGWDTEQALWFAFLNGNTQNPLTSLRLMKQLPEPNAPEALLDKFDDWFNSEWPRLQFDTDRRYQKKETPASIANYIRLVSKYGSQEKMLTEQPFLSLWRRVISNYHAFGRLGAWSYLEYVKIMLGPKGIDADTLFFADQSGSRSHRNGMLFLINQDHLVHDKRMKNNFTGQYADFKGLCAGLQKEAERYLSSSFEHPDKGMLTFESNLCTFKNSFFGRRYPGVYVRMARDRLTWYKENVGEDENFRVLRDIFFTLPEWLTNPDPRSINEIAAQFPTTGVPVNADHFM